MSCGLFLDDWQEWCVDWLMAETAEGRLCAPTGVLIVARQNGKNVILEVPQLAGLFLDDGVETMVHSAHLFSTAMEHFRRMKSLIVGSEALMELMPRKRNNGFSESHSDVVIETADGRRLKFMARQRGAGRGFSGERLYFDEAQILSDASRGAMVPQLAAKTMDLETSGVQLVFAGSAPLATSEVLHEMRARGQKDDPADPLFYAEWGNERGTDIDDRDALFAANPGLNVRIAESYIMQTEKPLLAKKGEYGRERLGIPDDPTDGSTSPFPPGAWDACCDPGSVGDPSVAPVVAVDVHPDLASASIAGARPRADGLTEVVLIDWRQGTHWLVPSVVETCSKHRVPVIVDPRSAAGGFIDDLEKAGVTVVQVATKDLVAACVKFQRGVVDATLRHRGQYELDVAVHGAAVRTVGEGWAWTRLTSKVDISPLVAATLAVGGQAEAPRIWSY